MHIEVIQTDNHPSGAGGRPLVAPAIAAAVAETHRCAATHPFLPERVKKALGLNRQLSPWAGRGEPSSEAIG